MRIKDIINYVNRDKKSSYTNLESIAVEFDIYEYINDDDCRIQCYSYAEWMCTDTAVGGRVYYLDNEPICVSWQAARKSDEIFSWVSQKAYDDTHIYLLELLKGLQSPPSINIINMDSNYETDNGFHVEFSSQIMSKTVFHKETGEMVEIINDFPQEIVSRKLEVKFKSGDTMVVETSDVLVPYKLSKEYYRVKKIEKIL